MKVTLHLEIAPRDGVTIDVNTMYALQVALRQQALHYVFSVADDSLKVVGLDRTAVSVDGFCKVIEGDAS